MYGKEYNFKAIEKTSKSVIILSSNAQSTSMPYINNSIFVYFWAVAIKDAFCHH